MAQGEILGMDDLIAYLTANTQVGQEINLEILRSDQRLHLPVTLEARPDPAGQPRAAQQNNARAWLGISAVDLSSDVAKAMDLPENQEGVLVQQVEDGSPADIAGLRGGDSVLDLDGEQIIIGGDVIVALDGQSIETVSNLVALLAELQPGENISLSVLRDGEFIDLSVQLGER